MRTYYTILGIDEHAPTEEIKRAYRRLARKYHPDVAGGSGTAAFRQVCEAYETLSDECRRRRYDARLQAARRPPEPAPAFRPAPGAAAARGPGPFEPRWFLDEVGIDFPSIAETIERIRRTFEGPEDERAPLRAEILVTPREASEGVEVPLDVPVSGTCPDCGGRGEDWAGLCLACGGRGEASLRYRVRVSLPPGVTDGTRFRFTVGDDSRTSTWVEVRVAVEPQATGIGFRR
jgi:molecular chaperone DnaJ